MPGIMLQWRSVAKHSRRYYGDVTKGLYMTAEMVDVHGGDPKMPHVRDITPDARVTTGKTDPLLHHGKSDPPASDDDPEEPAAPASEGGDTPQESDSTHQRPQDTDLEFDVETGEVIPDDVGAK
jgi:hypothetical protein